jgi:hypothetical protein
MLAVWVHTLSRLLKTFIALVERPVHAHRDLGVLSVATGCLSMSARETDSRRGLGGLNGNFNQQTYQNDLYSRILRQLRVSTSLPATLYGHRCQLDLPLTLLVATNASVAAALVSNS